MALTHKLVSSGCRIPAILDLMETHGVPYSSFVYNVLISWRGSKVGVAAAEACYREAEAAGKLDGVSVSSMLAIYDAHGMVRGRNRLDVVWAV